MMNRNNNDRRAFYVVQFVELPFESIDDYVCVPCTWLIRYNTVDQRAVVTYPKDEDPFNTRDRVKRKERYSDEWKFYVANVKYETDSYRDAEYWIATRNDYGPLVEQELKTIDTEPKFPLNKKLRIANHSSKLNDNSRKPLPRISIKRPELPKPNKQLDGKLMKLDDAAQSSSTVVTDANAEPGSSRQEQSIIAQDDQPIESVQTGTTASDFNGTSSSSQQKDENLQESLPTQEQQESSIPSVDVDTPILVIDDDEEVQPTSIEEQQVPSNQTTLELTEQPEPIREPQILVDPSREMTSNNQESQKDDVLNDGPTSHQLRNLPEISAQLYRQMNEARRLIPTQKPVKKKIHPMNITRNLAIAEQNPLNLMDQTGSLLTRSVPTQQRYHMSSNQNQYQPINRNNFEEDLLKKSAESNNYEQRSNLRAIGMSTPSIGQNSINPSNPFYQTSELPHPRQSRPTQQDSQQQPQKPKIRIGISIRPKKNRRDPAHQVTKKTVSPILTKVLNALRQAQATTHSQYLLNDQQFQENRSIPINENHLNEIDNMMQTDEWVKEGIPSAHHGENSNSDSISDHEGISDHEMSADKAPIERTNNFDGNPIPSGSSYADRPIAAQNSTNHQTHSKVVLEQQMLDNFAELFTQMGSTLRSTCDMYNTLRSSILDTAETYKKLLGAVEQFNSTQNSAGSGSFKINLKPEVQQSPEENQTEATASTSSSTQNQQSNDDATKPQKKIHNSWRFVLPSEYDPHNTKWTLKYRTNLPGLVELVPQTGVYVSYGDLIYCQQVSKDCKSLACRLLLAVFNQKALSVCSTITEDAQASDDVGSNIRPELDSHAFSVLLSFVIKYGLYRGWNIDLQPILRALHSKIQEIRFKYGVVVQC